MTPIYKTKILSFLILKNMIIAGVFLIILLFGINIKIGDAELKIEGLIYKIKKK